MYAVPKGECKPITLVYTVANRLGLSVSEQAPHTNGNICFYFQLIRLSDSSAATKKEMESFLEELITEAKNQKLSKKMTAELDPRQGPTIPYGESVLEDNIYFIKVTLK